jgi:hypothetical protein
MFKRIFFLLPIFQYFLVFQFSKTNQNEETFYSYQNELKDLNKIIKNLGKFYGDVSFCEKIFILHIYIIITFKIIFVPSRDKIVADSIGKFVKNEKKTNPIKLMLKYPKFRTLNLDVEPYSICVLPNGNLLSCNYESLSLYDKTLQKLKTVSKIDTQSLFCFYATTNNKDKIYFSNSEENQIIMTDLELNKIKFVGSYGKGNENFDYPRGLAFYKNFVYICDYGNKRLQKLNEALEFDRTIQLDYCPIQIKISNDVVFVGSLLCLYFYDIETFGIVKHIYDGHNGTISEINSNFYEYYSYNKKFYCYDRNGELIEEIQTDGCNNSNHNGCIGFLNGVLVISSYESKKLVVIDGHE